MAEAATDIAKSTPRLPRRLGSWYFRGYNFTPDVVFDVGVFDGTTWLYKSFPDAKFVLIDPQEKSRDKVEGKLKNFDFHAVALGDTEGEVTLRIPETKPGRGGAMASILPRADRTANRFNSIEEVTVPIQTLDSIAADYDGRIGLKIDTEGYEAQVLAGATETLKRTDFVVAEVSVAQRFEGVSQPSTLFAMLAEAGLEFRDVLAAATYPGKRPRPQNMDLLFTRWGQ